MSTVTIEPSFRARSKSYRLYGVHEMTRLIRDMDGTVYSRRSKLAEYQLRAQEYTLVLVVNKTHIDVITQMHHHIDHHADPDFEQVHVDSAAELCEHHQAMLKEEMNG